MNAVRLGIIGFGRIGAEHANWLGKCEHIRAVAAADITPARREIARRHGLAVHEHFREVLADPEIDAVLVASPTSMHFEQAAAALAAGKHVMVEKPVALDLDDARRLADVAARYRRVLSVFHNRRWDADYLAVKSAIASGMFGRIFNVESRLGQWASCVGPAAKEYRPNWRNESAFGGGGLLDWGSHFVDQIWQLLLPAKPVRVFAQLRHNVWSADCDDFARVCIDFDSGAVGLVEINTTTMRPLARWHIDGSAGSAEGPHDAAFEVARWAKLEFAPVDDDPYPLPSAGAGLSETQIWDQFAGAVTHGWPPAVTMESVFPTMALLDAARQSSRLGEAVHL